MSEMASDEEENIIPFQLQFDKPIPFQIKIAEWNPEKDLLAMVTEDSKILLHRFNWQRLWTISPGKPVTSLCWRPDGKAIAVGLEDGTIALHDVENGKLLRSLKPHSVAVVCLNWEEDGQSNTDESDNFSVYEDRTSRFFPPAPRAPKIPGLVAGDSSFMDDGEDSLAELSNTSFRKFNILCSGDRDGSICFSIFGIFQIGKINIHELFVSVPHLDEHASCKLFNASIYKVALSKDLCRLVVMCTGELRDCAIKPREEKLNVEDLPGLHCLAMDTSIFWKRKYELHQVAQQASNIEDLTEVIRASLSVMSKQWADAMKTFHDKFHSLSTLIIDNGLESSPQEEFLSLLGGARISPALNQFLVNSLGEVGVKRVLKSVCGTGKELQQIVLDHLQPAAEIIGFRMGELRGLSRWRARYQGIGLDEILLNEATENTGLLLVQVQRFMMVLSSVVQQFSNFFNWLVRSIKYLMQEPNDQLLSYNSELLVVFLKFLYDQDPVKDLLEPSEAGDDIEIDLFKMALQMPFTTISRKISCMKWLPLCPLQLSTTETPPTIPMSLSFYKNELSDDSPCQSGYTDYISFQVPNETFSEILNCIGIAKGFKQNSNNEKNGYTSLEAVLLSVPNGYTCVDLSLYKDKELVLLLNKTSADSEGSGEACMMVVQTCDLPFISISRSSSLNQWEIEDLKGSIVNLEIENEKVRKVPHSVIAPLAVSASRGVACVFAERRRALVYILEEDEDEEISDDK
ncbi:anaphase-promoting complex subunit 4 isoform X2 [Arabidopsis lyrata subsp. lyrata]|uniref:anaphase-promoting complex subunit 4 isoform X2 n=1 Tax=Arabidopsis lyrata subsp. lyrata TaxID=81972 RepID=UPI000A29AC14|nr:anaphase-promoting complex subunit 4 isoform X2 [Arabidopsis lyrata subsp. lyrata]|eukprot:XP_020873290.1 anaphase-promoting complex subunit 4 isoform X2 [Arabidopsis lyrata subsp. lyrata]